MNSTVMRVLAVLLAIGALLMAWSGYRLSVKSAKVVQVPAVAPHYAEVVAARDIPVGVVVAPEDVRLASTSERDPHGYESVHDVIGNLTVEPIGEGRIVLSSAFAVLGAAAQKLYPGERGIAIKVSEVAGVGGFVSPGDHVDVLLYLRGDQETANTSSAQVVLRDVRVLAYGDRIGKEETPMLQNVLPDTGKKPDAKDAPKKPEVKQTRDVKSAVLAVPENDAARLMLADSGGVLRLALRGAEPKQGVVDETTSHFVRLAEIAHATPAASPIIAVHQAEAKPVPIGRPHTPSKKEVAVIVHQGDKMEVVNVSN